MKGNSVLSLKTALHGLEYSTSSTDLFPVYRKSGKYYECDYAGEKEVDIAEDIKSRGNVFLNLSGEFVPLRNSFFSDLFRLLGIKLNYPTDITPQFFPYIFSLLHKRDRMNLCLKIKDGKVSGVTANRVLPDISRFADIVSDKAKVDWEIDSDGIQEISFVFPQQYIFDGTEFQSALLMVDSGSTALLVFGGLWYEECFIPMVHKAFRHDADYSNVVDLSSEIGEVISKVTDVCMGLAWSFDYTYDKSKFSKTFISELPEDIRKKLSDDTMGIMPLCEAVPILKLILEHATTCLSKQKKIQIMNGLSAEKLPLKRKKH